MLFILALIQLSLGIVLLIAALFPIRQLIISLPHCMIRRRWWFLSGLTILFLLGYIAYGISFWDKINSLVDLIVPSIFFLGACFVWQISSLSLQTTNDVRRVYLLEKENITDPLTGIYNRRYLERRLEDEFIHAKNIDSTFSILLIDIDHFKNINDTYGHSVGDQVLTCLVKNIYNFIRASDIMARFGGDEFVVISFNTSPTAALAFAQQIIPYVESHELMITNEQKSCLVLKTSISIGVAGLTDEVNDIQHLISNADKALYCAKRDGRGCAAVYPSG